MILCFGSHIYAETNNQIGQEDAKVSITLWPKYQFVDDPDLSSILIKGSWIGDAGGQFVYNGTPTVNTVDISCNKSDGVCIESRAEVSPVSGNLIVQSFVYQISRWDKDEVEAYQKSDPYSVMGYSIGGGRLTLRLDRNNKSATLIGEYEMDGKKGVWNAHLDSGEKLMGIYTTKKK
ncbi:MAG: hypothetical protein HQL24_03420 [Candidatus Omnitrophica bacterium]|nr:hypothetical protein [Candidatus Omnitrophota bacterium]